MERTLVSFDWAIKKLLRNKEDHVIVEGLLTVILGRTIKITKVLESESNQNKLVSKFNRVDLLAESDDGELMLFEIQHDRELDYFYRMMYGTSKIISEYLKAGDEYSKLRKVYSINIVYFDLGQGKDYVYHGQTEFVSLHDPNEKLQLSQSQKKVFKRDNPSELFPEYYLLKVNQFDALATTPLDEWINFLKTSTIPETATAPGLKEARERLKVENLTEDEYLDFQRRMEDIRHDKSIITSSKIEGWQEGLAEGRAKGHAEGLAEGRAKGHAEGLAEGRAVGLAEGEAKGRKDKSIDIARKLKTNGIPSKVISQTTGLSFTEIEEL